MRSTARTGYRRVSAREGRSGAMHGGPVLRQQMCVELTPPLPSQTNALDLRSTYGQRRPSARRTPSPPGTATGASPKVPGVPSAVCSTVVGPTVCSQRRAPCTSQPCAHPDMATRCAQRLASQYARACSAGAEAAAPSQQPVQLNLTVLSKVMRCRARPHPS
eukprot:7388514-Prymnesium_polylepis.1